MRILRLDLGLLAGTIDFHPFVSVATDLDESQRFAITGALRELVRGGTNDPSGLVESNGELLELADTPSGRLGPFTTEDVILAVDARTDRDESEAVALRAELDQSLRQAESDAVHVEEIRADLNATALATVQRLRQVLAGTAPAPPEVLERKELLQAVHDAATAASQTEPVLYESRPEIIEIVDRWNDYNEAAAAASAHTTRLAQKTADAEAGLRRAEQAFAEAQRSAVPVMLSAEDDARVAELAELNFDRRSRRGKCRTEDEEAELERLLGKVDQPTHSAYAMYRLSPNAAPEALAAVARAEQSVERARHNLACTKDDVCADPIVDELARHLEEVTFDARTHLGHVLPPDIGSALLGLRSHHQNPQWVDAVEQVTRALDGVGAVVDSDVERGDVAQWATEWLHATAAEEESNREDVNRAHIERELSDAERILERHAEAMQRISRLEQTAAMSARQAAQLGMRLDRSATGGSLSAADLLSRTATLANLIRNEAGDSVPLLLVGDFELVDDKDLVGMLDEMESLTEDIQLIILSERSKVREWAEAAGLRRALASTVMSVRI